jgi:tetratricopeptide (TPR) repeat protein
MRHKNYFITLISAAMLLACSVSASAQVAQLRGHVIMTNADGTKTPVDGAVIDVFRTDIAGKYETKTDKKGIFRFAGLPLAGTYTIAASAPNARPDMQPNVKVGLDNDYELVLAPGDGKRLTLDEVKQISARGSAGGGGGGGSAPARTESKEERAAREEMERKNAEIAAQNSKNVNVNAVLNRTFKAGQEALGAKRWDDAITNFKEGLAADPEQDALWVGLAEAYRLRGAERYNAAVKIKDNDTARDAGLKSAQQDWREAANAATKAVEIVKKKPAPTDPMASNQAKQNRLAAFDVRAKAMLLFVSKVDTTQADAGLAAFNDYIEAEPDAAKKAKARNDLAKMLLDAGAADKALAEYQKILTADPDNIDALIGAGLALYNLAYASNDKAKFQEAANYLQRFVDKAPDTNPLKADAKAVLEEVKNQQNIKPEKTAPATRRRRP